MQLDLKYLKKERFIVDYLKIQTELLKRCIKGITCLELVDPEDKSVYVASEYEIWRIPLNAYFLDIRESQSLKRLYTQPTLSHGFDIRYFEGKNYIFDTVTGRRYDFERIKKWFGKTAFDFAFRFSEDGNFMYLVDECDRVVYALMRYK